MPVEPHYTVGELVFKAFVWILGAIGTLFMSLLAFLAKKHLDNIDLVKSELIAIKSNLKELKSDMEYKITHLDNNVKNWKQGNDKLLEDIISLEKAVTNLEKEDIRILSELKNGH